MQLSLQSAHATLRQANPGLHRRWALNRTDWPNSKALASPYLPAPVGASELGPLVSTAAAAAAAASTASAGVSAPSAVTEDLAAPAPPRSQRAASGAGRASSAEKLRKDQVRRLVLMATLLTEQALFGDYPPPYGHGGTAAAPQHGSLSARLGASIDNARGQGGERGRIVDFVAVQYASTHTGEREGEDRGGQGSR